MKNIVLSLVLVICISLLVNCAGTEILQKGSNIVGKWALTDQKQICFPIRGFDKIEFFDDQTVVYYDIIGGEERSVGITADYSFPGDNRIKINVRTGLFAGTDLLDYQLSNNTLGLCNGNNCCNLVRE